MRQLRRVLLSCVYRLRGPERFIHKLQAMTKTQVLPQLHQLDQLALQYGIEVIEMPLSPGVDGIATAIDGRLIIALRADLAPFNRQFVLAHEMGHACLHLAAADGGSVDLAAYVPGGDLDIEADTFAILCLMDTIPSDRLVQDGIKYMLTNPNMIRRAVRVLRYFSAYRLRIGMARLLECMLPADSAKGAV
jgi:Zn-dependent peptidase ImmA (M78 family)